jgi:hypothetical protein
MGTDFDTHSVLFFSFDGKPGRNKIGWKMWSSVWATLLKQNKI